MSKGILEVYWLGRSVTKTFPHVPLREVHDHECDVVTLAFATFRGTPDNFSPPYVDCSGVQLELENDVRWLKERRPELKVLISVTGDGRTENGIGWSAIPEEKNEEFARWLRTDVVERYGLDGIDVDDEYYSAARQSKQLCATLWVIRQEFGSRYLLKKALFMDFEVAMELAQVLDYGTTMSYGDDLDSFLSDYWSYFERGFRHDQLMIGVQAGPTEEEGNFTSIETTRRVAEWEPDAGNNRKRGVMLYSFSQDIQNFCHDPQHSVPWPSANDHAWQNIILLQHVIKKEKLKIQ